MPEWTVTNVELPEGAVLTLRPQDAMFPMSITQGSNTVDIDWEGARMLLEQVKSTLAIQ